MGPLFVRFIILLLYCYFNAGRTLAGRTLAYFRAVPKVQLDNALMKL